jgi:hypothetical protein
MPGVDELAFSLKAVAAALKEMGDGGLVRELSRAIGDAVAPAMQDVRDGLDGYLPNRYAAVLGDDLKLRRSTSTAGDEARVTILGSPAGIKKRKLAQLDAGVLKHPVYGNRNVTWPAQAVEPGFFTNPLQAAEPDVREAIDKALDDVAEKAAGKSAL